MKVIDFVAVVNLFIGIFIGVFVGFNLDRIDNNTYRYFKKLRSDINLPIEEVDIKSRHIYVNKGPVTVQINDKSYLLTSNEEVLKKELTVQKSKNHKVAKSSKKRDLPGQPITDPTEHVETLHIVPIFSL